MPEFNIASASERQDKRVIKPSTEKWSAQANGISVILIKNRENLISQHILMQKNSMKNLPVSTVIESLRHELVGLNQEVSNQEMAFKVEEAEIELKFSIVEESGAGGGFNFYVLNARADGKQEEEFTQTITLRLKAVDFRGRELKIGHETVKPE